jgi:hypothetical protein
MLAADLSMLWNAAHAAIYRWKNLKFFSTPVGL